MNPWEFIWPSLLALLVSTAASIVLFSYRYNKKKEPTKRRDVVILHMREGVLLGTEQRGDTEVLLWEPPYLQKSGPPPEGRSLYFGDDSYKNAS